MSATSDQLQQAIQAADANKLRELLKENAALANAPLANGVSPVMLAMYYGRSELAQILLQNGAEEDIYVAAATGNSRRVAEILDRRPELLNAFAPDGHVPLGLAAFFGKRDVVKLLLDRGADVNVASQNAQKVTP